MNDIVSRIRFLLAQLDKLKYSRHDAKAVTHIEHELHVLRDKVFKHKRAYTDADLSLYPEFYDPEFFKKLYKKKEFNKSKYSKVDAALGYETLAKDQCTASSFHLSRNQVFLKNFMSPRTHYNGILLYHGVGVGKTCAAISIAEQFRRTMEKPVLVLMPANLKDNFKRQIFDIDNLQQCTSPKYYEKVPNRKYMAKADIEKYVSRIINENYKFNGFLEFANHIEMIETTIRAKYEGDEDLAIANIEKQIRNEYSNRVIVIDEVHNVRSDKEDPDKKAPKRLLQVLSVAENVKLVMLTATPMYNGTKEIIWLLNFLLANDKRPLLNVDDIFDDNGHMTEEGEKRILNVSKGYISYMRGENPFSFPLRLYPNINNDTNCIVQDQIPTHDMHGKAIEEEHKISRLAGKLIANPMEEFQQSVYVAAKPSVSIIDEDADQNDDREEVDEADVDNGEGGERSHNVSRLIQISNIVYPREKGSKKIKNVRDHYGKTGFLNCFEKIKTGKSARSLHFKYKDDILKKHGEFLDPSLIAKFSSKLKSIVDYILNSEGIVFVYSYYIYSGLLPLAIALEHAGFQRSDGGHLVSNISSKGGYKVNGKPARYSMLTRDADLHTDINDEVKKIRSQKNIDGGVVKVILGTTVAAEGIDFKNIRQIHILEPWFHLNKLEQVIGRAIRKCSHQELPIEKRNVTVYHHAACTKMLEGGVGDGAQSKPKSKKSEKSKATKDAKTKHQSIESIDLRIYRIAENKQVAIENVEKLLMSNAIDCNLNKHVLNFPKDRLKMKIPLTTSQGVDFDNFKIGDAEDDKHSGLKCKDEIDDESEGHDANDERTFHTSFIADEADIYVSHLAKFFQKYSIDRYENILRFMKKIIREFDEDVLKYALEYMLTHKYLITNKNRIDGFLVYFGNHYMFQPQVAPEAFIPFNARKDYKSIKQNETMMDDKALDDLVLDDEDRDIQIEDGDENEDEDKDEDGGDESGEAKGAKGKKATTKRKAQISADHIKILAEQLLKDTLGVKSKEYRERFIQTSYDSIVDRLRESELLSLVDEVLQHMSASKKAKATAKGADNDDDIALPKHVSYVVKSLKRGHILVKSKALGTYLFRNYYASGYSDELVDKDKLEKLSGTEQEERQKAILIVRDWSLSVPRANEFTSIHNDADLQKSFKKVASDNFEHVQGFIEVDAKGSKFKVIGSQNNSGGSVCGTGKYTITDYIDQINTIEPNILSADKKYVKKVLCPIYEMLLRKKEGAFLRPFQKLVLKALQQQKKTKAPSKAKTQQKKQTKKKSK
jgi:superfamily II DNA or RNA helicase